MKKFLLFLVVAFVSVCTSAQKSHFGMALGYSYDVNDVGNTFTSHYGIYCDAGGTGDHYQIRLYLETECMDAKFKHCTIDFYKGYFWKIVYDDIQSDPRAFANKLEWNYSDYSISDSDYEYKFGDVEMKFNGEELRFVSDKVTRKLYEGIRGGFY